MSFQMEHLYMDVLYTIKYKVGADTEMSAHRDQLYVYAQKAFDVTPEQHRRYMAIVHEEKVSLFFVFIYLFILFYFFYVDFRDKLFLIVFFFFCLKFSYYYYNIVDSTN